MANAIKNSSSEENLQSTSRQEVLKCLSNTLGHGLLALAHPDARVVLLLVGLVGALGVADLGPEVVNVVDDKVADAREVGPLQVRVEVNLDDAVADGGAELLDSGAGAAMEDEEDGLLLLAAELLAHESLVLAKQLGVELDIAGLVYSVDAAGCVSLMSQA